MKRTLAVSALVLVASCGGDDASLVASGQDVADLVGCTGFENSSEEVYVTEGGPCEYAGGTIFVYYFAETDDRDGWVTAASAVGAGVGVDDDFLVGDGFVVSAPTAVLEQLLSGGLSGSIASDG